MRLALLCGISALLLTGCATPRPNPEPTPEPAALPAQIGLPDVLLSPDGVAVRDKAEWTRERRPELKRLFTHYMYGPIPPAPARMRFHQRGEYPDFLGGKATLKLIEIHCGPETNAPVIDLLVVVPNSRRAPAPVFLAMNFAGNHATIKDRRVPLSQSWIYDNSPGTTNNRATDAARGIQATNWPLETIIDRGYALATFYSGDIDPDRKEASGGVYAWLSQGDPARNRPEDRGSIAAWAWGFQRCVDYLVKDKAIDAARIAAVGHSRNGKTALLAAAFDERIAMAFPHQAGCGGTAPSRGKVGESVKAINDRFPHWFNGQFKAFNDTPERLPFDQHCLMALCAPRPVLVSAATEDQWSNPAGQFEMTVAAAPVYRLFGYEGTRPTVAPSVGELVGDRLGYYLRPGKHSMTAGDWAVFLTFADRHWK
jgi:hypothetical protein